MENNIGAQERATMYEIFSAQYLVVPSEEFMAKGLEAFNLSKDIFDISFDSLIKEAKVRLDEEVDKVEQDYFDHFLVPISKNYIPLRESHLTGARRLHKGEKIKNNRTGWKFSTDSSDLVYNLNLAYDSVGFKVESLKISKDLYFLNKIDYLGYELAFMAYLNLSEDQAKEENKAGWRKLQKDFIKDHLLGFLEKYVEISEDRSNSYYKELGKTILDFVKWDLSLE